MEWFSPEEIEEMVFEENQREVVKLWFDGRRDLAIDLYETFSTVEKEIFQYNYCREYNINL